MAFNTCNSAGCHKFHDNRALYEDFLAKHLDEPANTEQAPQLRARNFREVAAEWPGYPVDRFPLKRANRCRCAARIHAVARGRRRLARDGARAFRRELQRLPQGGEGRRRSMGEAPRPQGVRDLPRARDQRLSRRQARHAARRRLSADDAAAARASRCTPKRGDNRARMRELSLGAPLRYEESRGRSVRRLPPRRAHASLRALAALRAVEERARRRGASRQRASRARAATCRAKSIASREPARSAILVQHNQNDNLRPNEKMIRPVCMSCHGLGYSIDALADSEARREQLPRPAPHAREELDMVAQRSEGAGGEASEAEAAMPARSAK